MARNNWRTPPSFIAQIQKFAHIGLDPCGAVDSYVEAETQFMLPDADGLRLSWTDRGLVFVNPPYGREIRSWADKIVEQANFGVEILLLCAVRTDARWFRSAVWGRADAVAFLHRRVHFEAPVGVIASSPAFPVALAYYGRHVGKFCSVFASIAKTIPLRREHVTETNRENSAAHVRSDRDSGGRRSSEAESLSR